MSFKNFLNFFFRPSQKPEPQPKPESIDLSTRSTKSELEEIKQKVIELILDKSNHWGLRPDMGCLVLLPSLAIAIQFFEDCEDNDIMKVRPGAAILLYGECSSLLVGMLPSYVVQELNDKIKRINEQKVLFKICEINDRLKSEFGGRHD